jgi:hypothetical protein
MMTQTGQENGRPERQTRTADKDGSLNNRPSGNRTKSKWTFTIPLRCLQRNALSAPASAFSPSVCGTHHNFRKSR